MPPPDAEPAAPPLLSTRDRLLIPVAALLALVVLNFAVRHLRNHIAFECPDLWPLGWFEPRPLDGGRLLTAAVVSAGFWAASGYLASGRGPWTAAVGLGALLILGTNLVHGWDGGFVQPISGGGLNGIQYYHDAVRVTDPGAFFRGFAQIQPNLGVHSRTHPPGAVLVIYLLLQVLQDPGAVGLALALVSTVVSGASFYGLLRRERLPEELRGYAVSLYLLTPAVQVYYAASIDALLAALLLGALYCVLNRRRGLAVAAVLLLYGASLLSFGALFALPVLAGLVAMRRVTLPRGAAVLLALVGLHGIVYAATGFDYLRSFRIASVLENPQGFRLLSEPVGYAITRVQGVLEILVYFGPFLALLAARGVRALRTGLPELWPLAPLGAGTLLAMFATGAFRTGETGRACLFVYPYVLLPVVAWLAARPPQAGERRILAAVVFGQAVLMQVAGSHFW